MVNGQFNDWCVCVCVCVCVCGRGVESAVLSSLFVYGEFPNTKLQSKPKLFLLSFTGYLDYWLACIHTYAASGRFSANRTTDRKKPALWPPVLIVCTHKDVSISVVCCASII